MHLSCFFTTF